MKAAITMRQALSEPRMLGNVLPGDSWFAWRTFLIAAMGEELTAEERQVFKQFPGREKEPGYRIEEALFLIGRRGGKDRAASVLATFLAVFVDWSPVLSKGETGTVVCIAPDVKQATIQRNYIQGAIESSPALARMIKNLTQDSIELTNGITIDVRSASFRRLRGVTAVAVIASETAFWYDDAASGNSDTEILNAIRPALSTTQGPVVLITTPYRRSGATWDFYKANFKADSDPALLCVQGSGKAGCLSLSEQNGHHPVGALGRIRRE